MIQLIVVALIASFSIWPCSSKADETNANVHTFTVPVSSLKTDAKPLYYRGRPLTPDNPMIKYRSWQDAMESARKFPDALSCLTLDPESESVSLASMNTESFKKIADLEICLQRVGSELGDLSRIEPWLRAIGFEWAEERPFLWLGPGNEGKGPALFNAQWKREDSFTGSLYPMSGEYNRTVGVAAKNMALELAIRRKDVLVISARVSMNICDQIGGNKCRYHMQ